MIEGVEAQRDVSVKTNTMHNDSYNPATRTINWDPRSALRTTEGGTQSPALGLGHEFGHAAAPRWLTRILSSIPAGGYTNLEEWRVIRLWEVGAATRLGEDVRYSHEAAEVFHVSDPTDR